MGYMRSVIEGSICFSKARFHRTIVESTKIKLNVKTADLKVRASGRLGLVLCGAGQIEQVSEAGRRTEWL